MSLSITGRARSASVSPPITPTQTNLSTTAPMTPLTISAFGPDPVPDPMPLKQVYITPCKSGGEHDPRRKFTQCGKILCVLFLPLGCICLFGMREQYCAKCHCTLTSTS